MNFYYTTDPLNGLINYYNKKYGFPKIYDYVEVLGHRFNEEWGPVDVIIDYSCIGTILACNWVSPNDEGKSFFIVHLKKHLLNLTSYTIQTRTTGSSGFPLEWKVSASYDNKTWVTIHNVTSNNDLEIAGSYKNFVIDYNYGPMSYFKLEMTETNSAKCWYLNMHKIELFGKLMLDYINTCVNMYVLKIRVSPLLLFLLNYS